MTADGGTLSFSCGVSDQLTQPLTLDGQGNFNVAATQNPALPIPGGSTMAIHLAGTIHAATMTLHEVYASGQAGTAYTLTFAQAAPQFGGACPG